MKENCVSYYVHESEMARMERMNRRLLFALVISWIALAASKIVKIFR